jgi:Ca2+:H+ antiporter
MGMQGQATTHAGVPVGPPSTPERQSGQRGFNPVRLLLICVPLALLAEALSWGPVPSFVLAFLALIPLSTLLGDATEALAAYAGPRVGALVTGTLANVAELILMLSLLRAGQLEVLKSSITGSLATILLVCIGGAALLGGLKHGPQRFASASASAGSPGMLVVLGALVVPTIFGLVTQAQRREPYSIGLTDPSLNMLSLVIAALLVLLYALETLRQFSRESDAEGADGVEASVTEQPSWTRRFAIGILVLATIGVALVSEVLSHSVEPFGQKLGLSPSFVGFILLPLAGCTSDLIFGGRMARRGHMGLVLETLTDAARQFALIVVPVLVFVSLLLGTGLTLYFDVFQVVALLLAGFITLELARDGRTTWLEGAQLLTMYAILVAWFLLG